MELLLTAMGCGLALGALWLAGRRACQADTVALIGQTYLRASGGAGYGQARPRDEERLPWDC
jgi:hypothetical protein